MAQARFGHRTTALISFAMSMAAGGAQFLALIVLNHLLDKESFSRVSTVLGSFSVFFIIVELGLQGESIRRMSKDGPRPFLSSAVALRLALSIIAVLSALVFGWATRLSGPVLWGMFLFSLAYVPTSVLYTFEELGYATGDSFFVILYRLSRLFAVGLFVLVILAFVGGPEDLPMAFDSFGMFSLFAIYPAAIVATLLVAWWRLKSLPYLSPVKIGEVCQLVRSTRFLTVSTLFRWISGYAFSLLIVSSIGERNLSAYNVANIALTPLSIFTQVFINASLAKMYSGQSYALKPALLKTSVLVTAVTSLYILICSQPLFINLVFKRVEFFAYLRMFGPLALAQIFIAISSFISIIFIDKKLPHFVTISTAVHCLVVLCLAPLFTGYGLMDYATVVPLIGALVSFGYYIWELLRLTTHGDRSPDR